MRRRSSRCDAMLLVNLGETQRQRSGGGGCKGEGRRRGCKGEGRRRGRSATTLSSENLFFTPAHSVEGYAAYVFPFHAYVFPFHMSSNTFPFY